MKRILSVLVTLLACATAVSCGNSATTEAPVDTAPVTESVTESAETEEVPGASLDSLGERDFGGLKYTILDANTHIDLHTNIPGDSLNGELVNDALINRDAYLEERYNFDITYEQTNSGTVLKKSVLAGDSEYDFVIGEIYNTLSVLASNGVLYNLCDLPYLELSEQWWSPLMYEKLRMNEAMYFVSSDIAPAVYQSPCCMFMNLKLYNDYDVANTMGADIYQTVIDGKWTLEVLDKCTKNMDNDVNGDGKWTAEEDFYGFAVKATDESSEALLYGANQQLFRLTDDGKNLVFETDNQALYDVVEKVQAVSRNITYTGGNDVINLTFKEDRALFLQHKLESAAVHLRDMASDYLVLPMPKADESQEKYISYVSGWVSGFCGVPKTVDAEQVGFLTEALARYSHEFVYPIAFDVIYKEKDSRDPRTVEVLDIIYSNLFIDFGAVFRIGSTSACLTDSMFKGAALASALEKKSGAVEKAVNQLIAWWGAEE